MNYLPAYVYIGNCVALQTTKSISKQKAIQFTIEKEVNGQLPRFDVQVIRETDQVYRKPTHTNHYLNFASHYPLQHKLSVIRTLLSRASSIVTKKEDHMKELDNIYRSLAIQRFSRAGPRGRGRE